MKMRLSICTKDTVYAQRILNYFDVYYKEQISLSTFTEKAALLQYLSENRVNVILLGSEMIPEISTQEISSYASIGVLSEEQASNTETATIFKYQKAEQIYKKILGIYYDGGGESVIEDEMQAKTYAFLSVNGGSGASTAANAFVRNCIHKGKTLYLNLEQYGQAEKYFGEEGSFTLGDVIYAAKSKSGSLALKLESAVRQGSEGICYYASSQNPADLLEIKQEEMAAILKDLSYQYKYITIDMDNQLGKVNWEVLKHAHRIIVVCNGSQESIDKYSRFYKSLYVLEQQKGTEILAKLRILYNQFQSQSGNQVEEKDIPVLGGIPRFEHLSQAELISRMAGMNIFQKLLNE